MYGVRGEDLESPATPYPSTPAPYQQAELNLLIGFAWYHLEMLKFWSEHWVRSGNVFLI